MKDIYYHFNLRLEQDDKVFGEGPSLLLRGIQATGSLSQAARDINMSYSQAHGLLKKLSQNLGYPLLKSQVGGVSGGGTQLTPEAEELVKNYKEFHDDCSDYISFAFYRYFGKQDLLEAIDAAKNKVFTFVGGGGKTSLMWHIASLLAAEGKKVAVATTTRIAKPTRAEADYLFVSKDLAELEGFVKNSLAAGEIAAFTPGVDGRKIRDIDNATIDILRENVDYLLLEGDGAKNKPIKAPASHEPVIPACSDAVIAVIGAEVIGQPLSADVCHRLECFELSTGLEAGSTIDKAALAALYNSPTGLRKNAPPNSDFILCFNKADLIDRELLEEVALHMLAQGCPKVLATTAHRPRVLRKVWSNE